jgi:hypothetical protein
MVVRRCKIFEHPPRVGVIEAKPLSAAPEFRREVALLTSSFTAPMRSARIPDADPESFADCLRGNGLHRVTYCLRRHAIGILRSLGQELADAMVPCFRAPVLCK